ncbi:MAG: AI-2E family transporter [Nitrococcus sp.]|nr:AI-2E family transporter [Nitrococcus sp.]
MTQIAAVLLVVAGLYWAKSVLVPIAIAILLSFLLAPVADRLERFHLPRIASLIAIMVLTLTLVAGVGLLASNQVYSLADSLPKYRQNIEERLRFFTSAEPGAIGKAARMVTQARKDVAQENTQQQPSAVLEAERNDAPVPVQIRHPPPTGLELLKTYAAPVLGPLGKAGLVVIFVVFMLLQREDLRDRMIRLLGQDRLDVTTRAFDDAGTRISRYLLAQLTINLTYGLPVALGLWLLGLPGALLWGVLAALLRFIPFLGPWLAAAMPILLSLAVFDGWYLPLAVVGLFAVLELFSNNVMEPWLYGSSTGLSPVGVILAVVFWSALWGLVGLVLAIPLTVCLVVAGRHLPQFRFFTILLSRDPALLPAERFYQRLLAGDQDEVEELAAAMFAQVLRLAGVAAETGSEHTLVGEALTRVDEPAAALVCVSALPPRAVSHARYLCRRLASHNSRVPIIVGLWDVHDNLERMRARLTEAGACQVVTTFEGGADQIQRRLSGLAQISA